MAPKKGASSKAARAEAQEALEPDSADVAASSEQGAKRKAQGQQKTDGGKRRALERRDTAQQAERAMEPRLKNIPKATWATKRNNKGQTLFERVIEQIRANRSSGVKIGSKWWAAVFDEFELTDNPTDELEEPEDAGEDVDPDLLAVLASAHGENRVKATVVPLERYLDTCGPLSRSTTYGLLCAVQMSPTLPEATASKAQLAVLKFWARTLFVQTQHTRVHVSRRLVLWGIWGVHGEMFKRGI